MSMMTDKSLPQDASLILQKVAERLNDNNKYNDCEETIL